MQFSFQEIKRVKKTKKVTNCQPPRKKSSWIRRKPGRPWTNVSTNRRSEGEAKTPTPWRNRRRAYYSRRRTRVLRESFMVVTSGNSWSHTAAKRIHRILPGVFYSRQNLSWGIEAGQISSGDGQTSRDLVFGGKEKPAWKLWDHSKGTMTFKDIGGPFIWRSK